MSLAFRVELLDAVRPEMTGLIERHYEEIRDEDTPPVDINWPFFEHLEASGNLLIVTARDGEILAGYVFFVVAPLPHYRTHLAAHDDAHYLSPEYRNGWNGVRLIRAAEQALKEKGVSRVSFHHKNRADINRGAVFKRLGYAPVETIWSKRL